MSLIDQSYFTGPISLPQLGKQSVIDDLNIFINRYEPKVLQAALGYQLYLDFIDGLSQPIVDPKWLDLLDGKVFMATGMWPPFYWQYPFLSMYRNWFIPQNPIRKMEWIGFANGSTFAPNNPLGPELVLTAGSGANNPVVGTSVFTLSSLAGSKYWVERRGVGTLIEGKDISITNNGQTITLLAPGDQFGPGEIFIIHFSKAQIVGTISPVYTSPLAAYVYYEYMRDQVTQMTGVGVVNTQAQNAVTVSAAIKMRDAFNQMSKDIFFLWQMLEADARATVPAYTSYERLKINYAFFQPINRYDI